MASPKTPSEYRLEKKEREQKEYACGIMHASIEEAMAHAEQNLGFRDAKGELVIKLKPLLGTTRFSAGTVIGWHSGAQKRFRVDFERHFEALNAEAASKKNGVNKGSRGVHVNEEDFTRKSRQKICHPTESSLIAADLLWKRWSSKYGHRGRVRKEDIAIVDG